MRLRGQARVQDQIRALDQILGLALAVARDRIHVVVLIRDQEWDVAPAKTPARHREVVLV